MSSKYVVIFHQIGAICQVDVKKVERSIKRSNARASLFNIQLQAIVSWYNLNVEKAFCQI